MRKLQTLFNEQTGLQQAAQEPPKLKIGHTPIEIALGIDEQGRTTARKLYAFLELNQSNYAKWCKRNIAENDFAEENIDFIVLAIEGENSSLSTSLSRKPKTGRGNTQDYILTATFAKKLAMTSNSVKGEQAREYFIKVEEKLKEIAITIATQSRRTQAVQIVNKIGLDEIFLLDEPQAKTRYNIGRNRLLDIANEAGAVVRIGCRKNGYLREVLDDYFRRKAE